MRNKQNYVLVFTKYTPYLFFWQVNLSHVEGTGKDGRVLKDDVVRFIESGGKPKEGKDTTTVSELCLSIEPCRNKTCFQVSDQVQHKPGSTATEDGQRLEILDLERRGGVQSM